MGDKVTPGTPLGQLPTIRASFINDLVDLLAWAKQNGFGGRPGPSKEFGLPLGPVKIRNLVGGDCAQGEVVQLGDELLDDKDKRYPWFEGNAVSSPADLKWAILLEPIKLGEIGMALVSGYCLASVEVSDATHTHAAPAVGESALASGASGPIEILSPVEALEDAETPETRLLWCRLGAGSGGGSFDCSAGAALPIKTADDTFYFVMLDGDKCPCAVAASRCPSDDPPP